MIRDAVYPPSPSRANHHVQSRYAFPRLVKVMGESILEKISPLIGGLLRKSTAWELIDFLPFLGQLIHKFKVRDLKTLLISEADDTRPSQRTNDTLTESNF